MSDHILSIADTHDRRQDGCGSFPVVQPGVRMVSQRQEQRRSKRYRQDLVVELHDRSGSRELHALDVARHGMFIKTDDPPRQRHLVQLTVHLPSGPISAAVTVSRQIVDKSRGGDIGVGVQFFALSSEAKARWDEYITALAEEDAARSKKPVVGLPGQAPIRPSLPDAATFVVKLKNAERLSAFHREHVLAGGTVLFTPVLREIGSPVQLVVVHPRTDEEFVVPGVVATVHDKRPKRLEIHFLLHAPDDLDAFQKFVETGRPPTTPPSAIAMAERILSRDALPWEPKPLNAPMATLDLDFDVDVFAEHSIDEDDPIDWEMSGIDVDFSLDESSARRESPMSNVPQPSAEGRAEAEASEAPVPTIVGEPIDDDEVPIEVETSDVKAVLALDTGMRPTTYLMTCDSCDADPYAIDLGPSSGLLGLVADHEALWCSSCRKVCAVPRLVDEDERDERRAKLLEKNWKAEQLMVPLTFALMIADLTRDPVCPDCKSTLKSTKAVERLADVLVGPDAARVKTKVRCAKCDKGHLLAAPFRIG